MRNSPLDLSVNAVSPEELSLRPTGPVDLSFTELEDVAAPDVISFLTGLGTATAVSALIIT